MSALLHTYNMPAFLDEFVDMARGDHTESQLVNKRWQLFTDAIRRQPYRGHTAVVMDQLFSRTLVNRMADITKFIGMCHFVCLT
jgi:hypothetical protein